MDAQTITASIQLIPLSMNSLNAMIRHLSTNMSALTKPIIMSSIGVSIMNAKESKSVNFGRTVTIMTKVVKISMDALTMSVLKMK
jgi:hypothetical protein